MTPYWQSEDGLLIVYHGDARLLLPEIRADVLVTDPPYGVKFEGKQTRHGIHQGGYIGEDNPEIGPIIVREALASVKRAGVFPGNRNLYAYPKPDDIGCVYCPSGAGMGPWGFICFHAVLFYGKRPGTLRPSSIVSFDTVPPNGHPCPKPLRWMQWLIDMTTTENDVVLDPFLGSGTTLEAARSRNRRAIGIEIEEHYCDLAVRRLSDPPLLTALRTEQVAMFNDEAAS